MSDTMDKAAPFSVFKVGREAASSAPFWRELETLRRLAEEPHPRTTGSLASLSWARLEAERDKGHDPERPRRWDERRVFGSDPERGNEHVDRYMRRCVKVARRYLYSDTAAPIVHSIVRGVLGLEVLAGLDTPGVAGPLASTLAADVTGASWGAGATTLREQRYQHVRPRADDYRAAYAAAVACLGAASGEPPPPERPLPPDTEERGG